MKQSKSAKSVAMSSVKSSTSMKSSRSQIELPEDLSLDFEHILISTCKKFGCPDNIYVTKNDQPDHHRRLLKPDVQTKLKKITLVHPASSDTLQSKTTEDRNSVDKVKPDVDDFTIHVTAIYDNMHRLAEITISRRLKIPRVFMQVVALIVPYFEKLRKITIEKSYVDVYTIHELKKMLPVTSVTEVHLRDLFLPEGNFAILLEQGSVLQGLSLSRCLINDEVCKEIAAKLHFSEPGESHLTTLDLSSNRITDVGAKYIGDALRSNRTLRYLNLSDNHITDDGAGYILDTLMEFPLTYNEIMDTRRRYMKYLHTKMEIYLKCLYENFEGNNNSTIERTSSKILSRKGRTMLSPKYKKEKDTSNTADLETSLRKKAEVLAEGLTCTFQDPFSKSNTMEIHEVKYSIGNMALCYLNLSYNSLSFISVKKIQTVLLYQNGKKKHHLPGLIKIVIEGNNLPDYTLPEFQTINKLISKDLGRTTGKAWTEAMANRRKSRTTVALGNTK